MFILLLEMVKGVYNYAPVGGVKFIMLRAHALNIYSWFAVLQILHAKNVPKTVNCRGR